MLSNYITTKQVAEILRIDPKSAGFLVRQGKLPGIKIANRWLVDRSSVEEFAKTYEARRGRPTGWTYKEVKK